MTAQKTTPRRRLRDAFLRSISVLPLSWNWLHQNHPRYLLGVLFRLEKEPVTVSPAGARFIMKLSSQRSPSALREIHVDVMPAGKPAVKLLRSPEYHVAVVGKRGYEAFWLVLPVSCDHVNPLEGAAGA
jgi:hypothetical protein